MTGSYAQCLTGMALAAIAVAAPTYVEAHPHVWVDVKTTVVYADGNVKGFEHRWTFDDMYTAMAIQGLDKNGDGTYDREELAELTQVNIDGLKEFDYFTYPKLGETALKIGAPRDYWLEHANGILTLHFLLPLEAPVMANAQGFNFQVYDPSYFIAFDLAEKTPIQLSAGAPVGCKPDVGIPQADTAQAQQLGESFFQQLGGDFGLSLAKTVSIQCPKS